MIKGYMAASIGYPDTPHENEIHILDNRNDFQDDDSSPVTISLLLHDTNQSEL